MSTVSVVHQFKTFKLKVTPGTSSTEILAKATAHFKLDFATTGLFHNTTELPLDVPFRLLNLPAGAKLSLNTSKSKRSAIINIKVQLLNSPFERTSIVKKFENSTTIKQVLIEIEKSLEVAIIDQNFGLKFQSLTKVIDEDDIESTSLAQLGVGNSDVLKISFTTPFIINFNDPEEEPLPAVEPVLKQAPQPDEKTVVEEEVGETVKEPTQETKEHDEHVHRSQDLQISDDSVEQTPDIDITPIESPPEQIQHVYVYKPASEPIEKSLPDESIYEVTVDHARQYQSLLAQRAHDTPKQKRLRDAAKKPIKITNIEVRIRFPDGSSLQVNFKPDDSNKTLYEFVKGTLSNTDEKFTLSIPHPHKVLRINDTKLIENLTSRNLLVFQADRKIGQFLKDEYLEKARDLKEAAEVQLDLQRHLMKDEPVNEDDAKIHNGVLPKRKEITHSSSTSDGGKKVPKWLKFGKK